MSISDRLLENLFDSIYMICDIVKNCIIRADLYALLFVCWPCIKLCKSVPFCT